MTLSRVLRLALVPIGAAIAARGLQYLTEEAAELQTAIDERRAQLAAEHVDQGDAATAAPEDFPSTPSSSQPVAGKSSVQPAKYGRTSSGRRVGWLVAGAVAAFAAGAAVARALPPASPAQILKYAAPCGICGRPVTMLDAFPGHICHECWPAASMGPHTAGDEPAAEPFGDEDQGATYPKHAHAYGTGTCPVCGADGVASATLWDSHWGQNYLLKSGQAAGEPRTDTPAGDEPADEPAGEPYPATTR